MAKVKLFDLSSVLAELNPSELKQVNGGNIGNPGNPGYSGGWVGVTSTEQLNVLLNDYANGANSLTLVGNDPWGNNAIYFKYPATETGDPVTFVAPL